MTRPLPLPVLLLFAGQTLVAGIAGGVAYGQVMAASEKNATAVEVNEKRLTRVSGEMRSQRDDMKKNEFAASERNARLGRIEGQLEGIAANLNRLLDRK